MIPAIIRSAQDPEKISLFVKSIAVILALAGFDKAVVDEAGNQIASLAVHVVQLAATITALYGLFRKMRLGRWSA